jgi:hypothetical protein
VISTKQDPKRNDSPIEIKQDYNRFTEFTVIPPSFDYGNKNLVHGTLSNLEIKMKFGEVVSSSIPLGSHL